MKKKIILNDSIAYLLNKFCAVPTRGHNLVRLALGSNHDTMAQKKNFYGILFCDI